MVKVECGSQWSMCECESMSLSRSLLQEEEVPHAAQDCDTERDRPSSQAKSTESEPRATKKERGLAEREQNIQIKFNDKSAFSHGKKSSSLTNFFSGKMCVMKPFTGKRCHDYEQLGNSGWGEGGCRRANEAGN